MSRTYRRKGYEKTQNTSWDKQFNSFAGFYTEYDYELINPYLKYSRFNKIYRKPTKQEFSQKYWDVHADGRYGCNSLGTYFKILNNQQIRRENDREILKWMKNEDHEVMLKTGEELLDPWFYD